MTKKKNYSGKKQGSMYTKGKKKGNTTVYKIDRRRKNADCFVSTVCFGESAMETQTFRCWRDNYLLNKRWGRKFVNWYYKNGKSLSEIIQSSRNLKSITIWILRKIAQWLIKRGY